ncbi:MAG TPA: hypothetical protein VE970_10070, partial [Pseudolabrys sp.]|nr:hypothetical protein [Pseudolabrys sp.]
TPSEAPSGRNAAAIGFGIGAIAGAAIAGSAYNNAYYAPMSTVTATVTGYAYAPAYTYGGYGYDSPGWTRTGPTTSPSARSAN